MQIVIDIPKYEYEYLKANHSHEVFYGDAIRNGIPLPEHHGRLGDLDKLAELARTYFRSCGLPFLGLSDINKAPTIIPATEEGE